jgi:von Willebrand factor type A domain
MARRLLGLVASGAVSALLASAALGCAPGQPGEGGDSSFQSGGSGGSTGSSDGSGGQSAQGGSGSTSGAGGDGFNPSSGVGSGSTGSGTIDPGSACATSSAEATLIPVNMFITFDRSGSMKDNNKWGNASQALTAFFQDKESAGLRVALRFFPEGNCSDSACDVNTCATPAVPIGALAADPAPADAQEAALVNAVQSRSPASGGGTPLFAALKGAKQWASDYQSSHKEEKTVIILVTDGEPNGCDNSIADIATVASDAKSLYGVLTYSVGLVGSAQADMDAIANAGGTSKGFFVGNGNAEADLVAALKAIQGSQVACQFQMPASKDGSPVDPSLVNVNYTPGDGGMMVTFGQVSGEAACTAQKGGWYYDDPSKPTSITLCPSTCSAVQADKAAKIQVLLGCATKPAT